MGNAVFVASVASRYDDVLEQQYHFPATYLTRVQQAVGDWIVYYEPRRGGGRLAYFAVAFVTSVTPDPNRSDHYYAHLRHYQEFGAPVPLNAEGRPIESFLGRRLGGFAKRVDGLRDLPGDPHQRCRG